MKSQQKRTPAKKPKPSKMAKTKIDVTKQLDLDLGGYQVWGAGQSVPLNTGAGASRPTYNVGAGGVDTITIDSSLYASGQSITSPITYTYDPSNVVWSNSTATGASVNIDTNGINVKEGGDIKIGSKSLSDAIEAIEERLAILNPNPELEERWEQLKELRKQYIELEKDLLEKEKIMKILKEK